MSDVNCDDVLREIERYLDGEVDAVTASGLVEHFHECGSCFDRAEFQRRLKEMLRSKCHSEAPQHLEVRVRQAIASERLFPEA